MAFSGVIQLVHGEYDEFGESMAEFLDDHLMKVSDLFFRENCSAGHEVSTCMEDVRVFWRLLTWV